MRTQNIVYYHSPLGVIKIASNSKALKSISFEDKPPLSAQNDPSAILSKALAQLDEYFNGNRTSFTLSLSPEGTTFQQTVWKALQRIPHGQTISYGELAERLGDPNKVRAVGKANSKNPIPIVIPCHRVIGSDNSLVGYRGGIDRKKYLLKHEGALLI